MLNSFRKIESNKTFKDLLAVFRGLLAASILFTVLAVDIIAIDNHDKLGIPHVPITVLVVGTAIFLFSLLIGISLICAVFDINRNKRFKENKALSVFLSVIFLTLGIIFTVSSIAIGISLYSKSSVEIALLLANYLSLFSISKLLGYKEV